MTSAIVKVVTGLLIQARENLEDEKGFEALNSAPIITKLMPHILASISSLATSDPPSAVQVLTFIQEILPSVASLQNLYLLNQENMSSDEEENPKKKAASEAVTEDLEAASQHYAWVESEHPYKAASVNVYRVQFPSSVQWMSVEFDPQCSTTQPEDVLQLYIRNRNTEKAVNNKLDEGQMNEKLTQATTTPTAAAAASATSVINQNELASQKYTPVLKKFSEATNWPRQNVILPGNEVLFSLETASDYVKDDKVRNHYAASFPNLIHLSVRTSFLILKCPNLHSVEKYLILQDYKIPSGASYVYFHRLGRLKISRIQLKISQKSVKISQKSVKISQKSVKNQLKISQKSVRISQKSVKNQLEISRNQSKLAVN